MRHYITLIQYMNRNNYLESAVFKSWWTLFPLLCCPCFFSCVLAESSPSLADPGVHLSQRARLTAEDIKCRCQRVGAARNVPDGVKSWGERASEGELGREEWEKWGRLCLHRELSKVRQNGEIAAERLKWQRCACEGSSHGFWRLNTWTHFRFSQAAVWHICK